VLGFNRLNVKNKKTRKSSIHHLAEAVLRHVMMRKKDMEELIVTEK